MRLLDGLLVVELGTDVEDREEDQRKIVGDERIGRPGVLQEHIPPAQLVIE